MIKLTDLLKEIAINPGAHIVLTTPKSGVIYVDNKPIGIEIDGDHVYLDEYDEDVYTRYGINLNYMDHDEEYYPEEESEKLTQILSRKLSYLGAEIIDNGYNVSQIMLPLNKVQKYIKHDYPKYLGNGKFEYKGKTITYKQPNPDVGTYEVYDSNDKLISTFTITNRNFESMMYAFTHYGLSANGPTAIFNILKTGN